MGAFSKTNTFNEPEFARKVNAVSIFWLGTSPFFTIPKRGANKKHVAARASA